VSIISDFLAGIRGEEYPWAESIRWSCPKPTAPVYPPFSNGWFYQGASDIMAGRMSMAEWLVRAEATLPINNPSRRK
jgi:hypothetical protein